MAPLQLRMGEVEVLLGQGKVRVAKLQEILGSTGDVIDGNLGPAKGGYDDGGESRLIP